MKHRISASFLSPFLVCRYYERKVHREDKEKIDLKRAILIFTACLLIAPATGLSQTRRKGSTGRRPATTSNAAPDAARAAGAAKVADQIKNLTRFLYLYGSIAKDIQSVDASVQGGEASQSAKDLVEKNRASIRNSLVNVRDGLDQLEITFRTTPSLQPYYIKLAGSAAGAADAAQLAESGQYDKAGRALLNVVNRLTDVLLAMQQGR
jgi:hypothetical protein